MHGTPISVVDPDVTNHRWIGIHNTETTFRVDNKQAELEFYPQQLCLHPGLVFFFFIAGMKSRRTCIQNADCSNTFTYIPFLLVNKVEGLEVKRFIHDTFFMLCCLSYHIFYAIVLNNYQQNIYGFVFGPRIVKNTSFSLSQNRRAGPWESRLINQSITFFSTFTKC